MTPTPLPTDSVTAALGPTTSSRQDLSASITLHHGPSVADTGSSQAEINPHRLPASSGGAVGGNSLLERLPNELLLRSLKHLATPDLARVALSSRRLSTVSQCELVLRAVKEAHTVNELNHAVGANGERLLRLAPDEQRTVFRALLVWSALLPGGGGGPAGARQRVLALRHQANFDVAVFNELLEVRPPIGTLSRASMEILAPYLATFFDGATTVAARLDRTGYTDPGTRACRLAYWLEQQGGEPLVQFLMKPEEAQAPTLQAFAKHDGQDLDQVKGTVEELWERLVFPEEVS